MSDEEQSLAMEPFGQIRRNQQGQHAPLFMFSLNRQRSLRLLGSRRMRGVDTTTALSAPRGLPPTNRPNGCHPGSRFAWPG